MADSILEQPAIRAPMEFVQGGGGPGSPNGGLAKSGPVSSAGSVSRADADADAGSVANADADAGSAANADTDAGSVANADTDAGSSNSYATAKRANANIKDAPDTSKALLKTLTNGLTVRYVVPDIKDDIIHLKFIEGEQELFDKHLGFNTPFIQKYIGAKDTSIPKCGLLLNPFDKGTGNRCYINAAIQLLYSIPVLKETLKELDDAKIEALVPPQKTDGTGPMPGACDPKQKNEIKALKMIFDELDKGGIVDINELKMDGKSLYDIIISSVGNKVADLIKGRQNDSSTILNYFISLFSPLVGCIGFENLVKQLFIQAIRAQGSTTGVELDTNLSSDTNVSILSVALNSSIQEAINSYEKEEDIAEVDRAKTPPILLKRKNTIQLNDTQTDLIIQLKRYQHPGGDIKGDKLTNSVEVSKEITISGKKFFIKGCIIHDGNTVDSGHYRYIVFKNGEPFFVKNDSMIQTSVTKEELQKNGYIFLYSSADESPEDPVSLPSASQEKFYKFWEIYVNEDGTDGFHSMTGRKAMEIKGYLDDIQKAHEDYLLKGTLRYLQKKEDPAAFEILYEKKEDSNNLFDMFFEVIEVPSDKPVIEKKIADVKSVIEDKFTPIIKGIKLKESIVKGHFTAIETAYTACMNIIDSDAKEQFTKLGSYIEQITKQKNEIVKILIEIETTVGESKRAVVELERKLLDKSDEAVLKELESTKKFVEESNKYIDIIRRYRNAAVLPENIVRAFQAIKPGVRGILAKRQLFNELKEQYTYAVRLISNPSLKPMKPRVVEEKDEDEDEDEDEDYEDEEEEDVDENVSVVTEDNSIVTGATGLAGAEPPGDSPRGLASLPTVIPVHAKAAKKKADADLAGAVGRAVLAAGKAPQVTRSGRVVRPPTKSRKTRKSSKLSH